jgi:hypothetical protein
VEAARAASSRSVPVDPELVRSWIITATKLAKQLGLRPSVVDARAAPKPMRPMRDVLQEAGKL